MGAAAGSEVAPVLIIAGLLLLQRYLLQGIVTQTGQR
jgi:hypothetical protein